MADNKLLICAYINSVAGGKSRRRVRRTWQAVRRCIESSGVAVQWHEYWTRHADDVPSEAEMMRYGRPCVVLAVGGDGTFQQIAHRVHALEVPLAVVPLGTGNGIAASLGYRDVMDAARKIGVQLQRLRAEDAELAARAAGLRLDAIRYRLQTQAEAADERHITCWRRCGDCFRWRGPSRGTEQAVGQAAAEDVSNETSALLPAGQGWAYLSFTLGLVADLDIRTEVMRWLGPLRFDLGAPYYILRKRVFEATIAYRSAEHRLDGDADGGAVQEVKETRFLLAVVMNVTHAGAKAMLAPRARCDDGCFDMVLAPSSVSRARLFSLMTKLGSGAHVNDPACVYLKCTWARITLAEPQLVSIDGEAVYDVRELELHGGLATVPLLHAREGGEQTAAPGRVL